MDVRFAAEAPPMTDALVWTAKAAGALAGSLVSLAYLMPRGRRDAFLRLGVGVAVGLVFGGTAGVKIADWLDVLGKVHPMEIALVGAASCSLASWWTLGALERGIERLPDLHPLTRGGRR